MFRCRPREVSNTTALPFRSYYRRSISVAKLEKVNVLQFAQVPAPDLADLLPLHGGHARVLAEKNREFARSYASNFSGQYERTGRTGRPCPQSSNRNGKARN